MTLKRKTETKLGPMTQKTMRRGVKVGSMPTDVSPVSYWYKSGHFENDDEARGAFELAYQQAMDGMGESIAKWMGLTEEEFNLWHEKRTLPKKKRK
jgi:hypothetical protein